MENEKKKRKRENKTKEKVHLISAHVRCSNSRTLQVMFLCPSRNAVPSFFFLGKKNRIVWHFFLHSGSFLLSKAPLS
jgi:hypothetical protein